MSTGSTSALRIGWKVVTEYSTTGNKVGVETETIDVDVVVTVSVIRIVVGTKVDETCVIVKLKEDIRSVLVRLC